MSRRAVFSNGFFKQYLRTGFRRFFRASKRYCARSARPIRGTRDSEFRRHAKRVKTRGFDTRRRKKYIKTRVFELDRREKHVKTSGSELVRRGKYVKTLKKRVFS